MTFTKHVISLSICEMCCIFIFIDVLMYAWVLLLFHLISVKCESSNEDNEAFYECGSHGRFEYCIDGIPGCVVGCHCHPGFYFDTDTKICEPNIKLTKDYRRQYALEPTRSPVMTFTPVYIPTPTTANPVEEKVNAIAKDTDDIGDWLYNQFFKTIENQVINSTDDVKATRRSGNEVAKPVPKILRRSRKKSKKKTKNKKLKKKGLRRKLLRITEDDSLFDSTSSSDQSSSASSSSSGSETSTEEDDKEHGHRKLLMFNKKSTPSLPSFIFLPNVETPFYPPIGLPPPPIIPMYPMVPVPPVGLQTLGCETTSPPTTTTKTTNAEETTTLITTTTIPTEPDDVAPKVRARELSDERNKKSQKHNKPGGQNKMMQKLREKMKKRHKQPLLKHFPENYQDQDQDPETPYSNNPEPPSEPFNFRSRDMYNSIPPMEDVDFKYLSQLIHKIDLNKTKPAMPFKLKPRTIDLPNQPFRRNYQYTQPVHYNPTQKMRPASKADETNDSFYSNLGKQIASLIRKVDSDGERQINIEIEQQNQDPMQTMFNENRYAPRSYWERFVRSPLKGRQSHAEDLINHLKESNEHLFNLEDQVNVATAIERVINLEELENIANVMQRTQSKSRQISSKNVIPATSSRSYNINLLPRFNRRANTIIHVKEKLSNNQVDKVTPNKNAVSTHQYNTYPTRIRNNEIMFNKDRNETNKDISTSPINKNKLDYLNNILKSPQKTPLHYQVSRIFNKNMTNPKTVSAQQVMNYQFNPMILNYKYVGNNHNQYQVQRSLMPFHMPFFSNPTAQSKARSGQPSYFHHETHHFDYFD